MLQKLKKIDKYILEHDWVTYAILWTPAFCSYVLYLYKIVNIDMKEILIVLIPAVVAGAVAFIIDFRKLNTVIDHIKERHTSQKAEEYHNLEVKDIQETRNDVKEKIRETRNDVNNVYMKVDQTNTDVKLLSKDLDSYLTNIRNVKNNDEEMQKAFSTLESRFQEIGQVYGDINKLIKENEDLKNQLKSQIQEINNLKEKVKLLEEQNKELTWENDPLHNEIDDDLEL